MFEGVPNYPDASRFWQVIDKHQVEIFYTAPTALRALMREGNAFVTRSSRSSLKLLGTVKGRDIICALDYSGSMAEKFKGSVPPVQLKDPFFDEEPSSGVGRGRRIDAGQNVILNFVEWRRQKQSADAVGLIVFDDRPLLRWPAATYGAFAIVLGCLVLTYSRGAMAGLALAGGGGAVLRCRRLGPVMLAAAGLLLVLPAARDDGLPFVAGGPGPDRGNTRRPFRAKRWENGRCLASVCRAQLGRRRGPLVLGNARLTVPGFANSIARSKAA
jgi:hypothetical protein